MDSKNQGYLQAKDEGITVMEKLLEPKTLDVSRLIMEQEDFGGSSDFQSLGLMYTLALLTRSSRVLEIGTWLGFSGLYFLDAISKCTKNEKKIFVTIDPNMTQQEKAKRFFTHAGFEDIVIAVSHGSQTDEAKAVAKQNAPYDILYIDSLHNYTHTKQELNDYFGMLKTGGILFCHDSSKLAMDYDTEKQGGVRKALEEFVDNNKIQPMFFESHGTGWNPVGLFMGIKM